MHKEAAMIPNAGHFAWVDAPLPYAQASLRFLDAGG